VPEYFIARKNCTSCTTKRQHVWRFLPVCGFDKCVSVGGSGVQFSASTFMLFRCMCLSQRESVLIKTKNSDDTTFDRILQQLLFISLRKSSEFMDSMLQKCVRYTGAYFKIKLIGSISALKLCKNCITTPFTSGDTVVTLKHSLYSRLVYSNLHVYIT